METLVGGSFCSPPHSLCLIAVSVIIMADDNGSESNQLEERLFLGILNSSESYIIVFE